MATHQCVQHKRSRRNPRQSSSLSDSRPTTMRISDTWCCSSHAKRRMMPVPTPLIRLRQSIRNRQLRLSQRSRKTRHRTYRQYRKMSRRGTIGSRANSRFSRGHVEHTFLLRNTALCWLVIRPFIVALGTPSTRARPILRALPFHQA